MTLNLLSGMIYPPVKRVGDVHVNSNFTTLCQIETLKVASNRIRKLMYLMVHAYYNTKMT